MKVIGVFGSSGSGKTTIARYISKIFKCVVLSIDNFYYGINPDMPNREEYISEYNFDDPKAINWKLLRSTIEKLKKGSVVIDVYDFATHTHNGNQLLLDSKDIDYIIVEGIHTWMISDICDLLVYIETDLDECFRRRLCRDMEERGREDMREIIKVWDKKVKPAYHKYIQANSYRAHLTVRNEDPYREPHLAILCSTIKCLGEFYMPKIVL